MEKYISSVKLFIEFHFMWYLNCNGEEVEKISYHFQKI